MPDVVLALLIVAAITLVISLASRAAVYSAVSNMLDREVTRREACHGSQVQCAKVENHPAPRVDA